MNRWAGSDWKTCPKPSRQSGIWGLQTLQALQHPVHLRAGAASGGREHHGQRPASRSGADQHRPQQRAAGSCGQLLHWQFAALPRAGERRRSVYLAASGEVEGVTGRYFVDCRPVPSSGISYDAELAARLWDMSVSLTAAGEPPVMLNASGRTVGMPHGVCRVHRRLPRPSGRSEAGVGLRAPRQIGRPHAMG